MNLKDKEDNMSSPNLVTLNDLGPEKIEFKLNPSQTIKVGENKNYRDKMFSHLQESSISSEKQDAPLNYNPFKNQKINSL